MLVNRPNYLLKSQTMLHFQVQLIQNQEKICIELSFLENANCRAFCLTLSIKFCTVSFFTFFAAERQCLEMHLADNRRSLLLEIPLDDDPSFVYWEKIWRVGRVYVFVQNVDFFAPYYRRHSPMPNLAKTEWNNYVAWGCFSWHSCQWNSVLGAEVAVHPGCHPQEDGNPLHSHLFFITKYTPTQIQSRGRTLNSVQFEGESYTNVRHPGVTESRYATDFCTYFLLIDDSMSEQHFEKLFYLLQCHFHN